MGVDSDPSISSEQVKSTFDLNNLLKVKFHLTSINLKMFGGPYFSFDSIWRNILLIWRNINFFRQCLRENPFYVIVILLN